MIANDSYVLLVENVFYSSNIYTEPTNFFTNFIVKVQVSSITTPRDTNIESMCTFGL